MFRSFHISLVAICGIFMAACAQDTEVDYNEPDAPSVEVNDDNTTRVSAELIIRAHNQSPDLAYGAHIVKVVNGLESNEIIDDLPETVLTDQKITWITTNLLENTSYIARAYVTNGVNRKYSARYIFSTRSNSKATLSTVSLEGDRLKARILDNGGRKIKNVGFIASDTPDRDALVQQKNREPAIYVTEDGEIKEFYLPLSTFKGGETYYFFAYAFDSEGDTGYSPNCLEKEIEIVVNSISLNLDDYITEEDGSIRLLEGSTLKLKASVQPEDASNVAIAWRTSDYNVATVEDGKVTAVNEGIASITATAGGQSASCTIRVNKPVIPVESITLSKSSLSLAEGESSVLSAVVVPADATDNNVIWASSDTDVATVSNGTVTGHKEGTATITASVGGKSATCAVSVAKTVIPVESINLSSSSLSLVKGETATLTATVKPDDATDKTIQWISSYDGIITVDQTGKIQAVSGGSARVTAVAGECYAHCDVQVTVPVSGVTLNKTTLNLTKGSSETLSATIDPSDATDKTVTWSSKDAAIASVDQAGKVTAVKSGKTTITVTTGEKDASCEVTITTPVESVSLDRTSVTLEEGQTTTLEAIVSPNDADDKTVTWTTSDGAVATVVNGVVTAVSEGSATISASSGGKPATCSVTVQKGVVAVTSITMNKATLALEKGQSETLTATVSPEDATDKTVTWSSSDATIASVDLAGKVTAVKSGRVTITAKAGEKSATCELTITTPVENITLDQTSVELVEGETASLKATVSPDDADEKTVTWTSSNENVVTVSSGGVATAVAEGSATITASAGGKSAMCQVQVQKKVVAVTSVTMNKTSLSLTKGQTETLTATVLPEDATEKVVTWSSSDGTIASVDQAGKVTAVKSGKATITAMAGEKSATCEVSITNPVASVSLDRSSVSLEEGQTTTLMATISPNDADVQTVTWSTSSSSIATVENGTVTAVAEGTAIITASAGGKSATCEITVQKKVVAVTSVTLNKAMLNLNKGQSETLTATVKPDDATDKKVTWSSSDATIASVDQAGKVTAEKSGKATITAKAGEQSATCEVTITTPVESVTLDQTSVELVEGETATLMATVSPDDADEKTVTWTSSDESVATVSSEGVVTAIAEGAATITASAGEESATCTVTVNKLETGVPVTNDYFPDDVFRNYVSSRFDTNHDGILSQEEANSVDLMDLDDMGITSLSGIECFESLRTLDCEHNELKEINLSHNSQLINLACTGCGLEAIDLTSLPLLRYLHCGENQFSSLDISKNLELELLTLGQCYSLSSLDVSQNTKLTSLYCSYNNLTQLNLSNNPNLVNLSCVAGKLTELDVSNNPRLVWLTCGDNSLTTLDVSHNSALEVLHCNNNSLTTIDLSNNLNLESFACSNNPITVLDLSSNTHLDQLECANTKITSLVLSVVPQLKYLVCDGLPIETLDVSSNPLLEELSCSKSSISSLDLSNCQKLTRLKCSFSNISFLDLSSCTNLVQIECSDNSELSSLILRNCTELKNIWCDRTILSLLDLTDCVKLAYLQCESTSLVTLDLRNSPDLGGLFCRSCPNLTDVWLPAGFNINNLYCDSHTNIHQ